MYTHTHTHTHTHTPKYTNALGPSIYYVCHKITFYDSPCCTAYILWTFLHVYVQIYSATPLYKIVMPHQTS